MITLTNYILASFATYYLARCISDEKIEGPWNVFLRIRNLFTEDDWKGRGVRCVVCMSCWTGLVVVVGLALLGYADVWAWPIVWFALAGGSVVIDRYWRR